MAEKTKEETSERDALEPVKFQPIMNRYFIFELPGLDSFLVAKVKKKPFLQKEKDEREVLTVWVYEVASPCTLTQIGDLVRMNGFIPPATLKYLDRVGSVVLVEKFDNPRIEKVSYQTLKYESKKPLRFVKIKLSYRKSTTS